MRVNEYKNSIPEPVTVEVLRKLRAAVDRARASDVDTHSKIDMGPCGLITVPVRWSTLERLIEIAESAND